LPVDYFPAFVGRQKADELLEVFLAMETTPEIIRMFGADIVTTRRTALLGAEYVYNALAKSPHEWTPTTAALRQRIETVAGPLDGALVQVYPDGHAGLGWHRDKGHPDVIASLSLGAERAFVFGSESARGCREVYRMRLAHGSLLLIPAATNNALKHRLPPQGE
jgi:alkylated DNA repair dioxygenase AlkB